MPQRRPAWETGTRPLNYSRLHHQLGAGMPSALDQIAPDTRRTSRRCEFTRRWMHLRPLSCCESRCSTMNPRLPKFPPWPSPAPCHRLDVIPEFVPVHGFLDGIAWPERCAAEGADGQQTPPVSEADEIAHFHEHLPAGGESWDAHALEPRRKHILIPVAIADVHCRAGMGHVRSQEIQGDALLAFQIDQPFIGEHRIVIENGAYREGTGELADVHPRNVAKVTAEFRAAVAILRVVAEVFAGMADLSEISRAALVCAVIAVHRLAAHQLPGKNPVRVEFITSIGGVNLV